MNAIGVDWIDWLGTRLSETQLDERPAARAEQRDALLLSALLDRKEAVKEQNVLYNVQTFCGILSYLVTDVGVP